MSTKRKHKKKGQQPLVRPTPSVGPKPPIRSVHKKSVTLTLDDVDHAYLALSLLAAHLRRAWKKAKSNEHFEAFKRIGCANIAPGLALWRPSRGHGKIKSWQGFYDWVTGWARAGGKGEYILWTGPLAVFLEEQGLNFEQVVTDWKDRGISLADPGHNTSLIRLGGCVERERVVVLPDRFVRSRGYSALGSIKGRRIAREAHLIN